MYSLEEKLSFGFLSFPSHTNQNQFRLLSPNSFKTVDPLERGEETSPVISYKIAAQGHQANFTLKNSLASTQTSYPPPCLNIYTISRRAGTGGKQTPVHVQQGFHCTWQSSGRRGAEIPRAACRGRHLLRAALQGTLACFSNPGRTSERCRHSVCLGERVNSQAFYRTKERQGPVRGENTVIESNLLPCYAAVRTFQLSKPKDGAGVCV